MFDILNKYQEAARVFDATTLVALGAACVLTGLVLWLGGMKFTRIIAAAVGFIGGAALAFYLFPENQTSAAITGAFIGAIIGIVLHQFITVIAGSAVFAMAVFAFLVGTNFSDKISNAAPRQESVVILAKLTPMQTLEQIRVHTTKVVKTIFDLSIRLPARTWPATAIALGALALLAILFWRLVLAFACSSLGAGVIFSGMFCLLLYKGSAPLTYVYGRITFFAGVFAAVVLAGMVCQLILCRPPKLKILKEQKEIEKKNKVNISGEHKCISRQS